jgi:hypothetical protein
MVTCGARGQLGSNGLSSESVREFWASLPLPAGDGYAVGEARRPVLVGGVVAIDAVQLDPRVGPGDPFEEGEELRAACGLRQGGVPIAFPDLVHGDQGLLES